MDKFQLQLGRHEFFNNASMGASCVDVQEVEVIDLLSLSSVEIGHIFTHS